MPDITRRGVTLTEAWQEAAAIAPITRAVLYAYEFWHPSFSQPIRFVNDKAPLLATIEAGAARNAGQLVEFLACPVDLQRPEESDSAASPTITLGRPDVGGILKAAFDAARGQLGSWTIIERVYASDDTSGPAWLPPLEMEVQASDLQGAQGKLTASFDDDANEAVPRITFKRSEYPGLKR